MKLKDNLRIHRQGGGPPLVLLHCLGVDHRLWDFAKPLQNDFTLIRYDFPGHGETPVSDEPYTIEDLTDQLLAVFDRLGLGRASVAGISLGGLVAQDFAARHPDRTDKVLLIDTTPRYDDGMRKMWAERAATARQAGISVMTETLLSVWFSADGIRRNLPGVQYTRDSFGKANGEGYALACEALAGADLREQAHLIKADALVVCGDDDIPSFIDAARWLAGHIPHAELSWIAGGRHASILEHPIVALEIMRKFLTTA